MKNHANPHIGNSPDENLAGEIMAVRMRVDDAVKWAKFLRSRPDMQATQRGGIAAAEAAVADARALLRRLLG